VEEEGKKTKQNMWCKGNHSPPSTDRPMPNEFSSKRCLASLKFPLFLFYCWARCYISWNISLVSLGHLPGCVPSQPLPHPLIYSLWG